MSIHDPVPRHQVNDNLNAADVGLISFKAGMAGVSVPSRMYNMLAAGLPIIGICDPESELARVIEEDDVGWSVTPGNPDALAERVLKLAAVHALGETTEHSVRCRHIAETRYSRHLALSRYAAVLNSELLPEPSTKERCVG